MKFRQPLPGHHKDTWWAPFQYKVFRMLWIVWLGANSCMWMNDVAASWMMTSLTTSPTLIALVQTASNIPVFLLGLPSGALADILNRKRYFMATQIWLAINAAILCVSSFLGLLNAPTLLFLTFLNGIGLAMRWPVFSAIVPDLVPKNHLQSALALNGIAMNASRIIGPLIAGALIASAGTEYVFALNMVISLASTYVIYKWKYQAHVSALPVERFFGAMRLGFQYVRESNRMRAVLIRVFLFFVQSSALLALLPVIAKDHFQGNAGTFTIMLSSLGLGAIISASQLPWLRARWDRNQLAFSGAIIQAICSVGVVLSPNIWIAAPLVVLTGMAWINVANSLSIAAQFALPGWVRARGMSFYQMGLMGGSAMGAALWGKVASLTDVTIAVIAGSIFGIIATLLTRHLKLEGGFEVDLTPVCPMEHPTPSRFIDPSEGPVMISIEYQIDRNHIGAFTRVMQKARSARLRQGAISWSLFEDAESAGKMIEYFAFETWADYLRRFDRFTTTDLHMQEERLKFHIGESTPKVTRRVASLLDSDN